MAPLGPVIMVAAGKPPFYSPLKIVDEIRRRGLSIGDAEYTAVKGIPQDWSPEMIRGDLVRFLDAAEAYIRSAPLHVVGLLAVDARGVPVELPLMKDLPPGVELRRATEEPEVMPAVDTVSNWQPPTP